jgi:hypothetical protein
MAVILGDIVPLCIDYKSSGILLADKRNYIYLVYLVFIRQYDMFRLSIEPSSGRHWYTKTVKGERFVRTGVSPFTLFVNQCPA